MDTFYSPITKGAGFGYSLDLYSNYAIVGTYDNHAFIYQKISNLNTWTLQASLVSPNTPRHYGSTVAIHENFALVGDNGFGKSFHIILLLLLLTFLSDYY